MSANISTRLRIADGAVVCEGCELVGEITIGARTVIHPKARIIAEAGPIIIGENNIIEELVSIVNKTSTHATNTSPVMIIGSNNMFEIGADIQALKIGDHNIVECKAEVGPGVELTTGCIVGAMCRITSTEKLPENTVIYGSNCARRVQRERPPAQTLQIDFLSKILPNYHHLRRSSPGLLQQVAK